MEDCCYYCYNYQKEHNYMEIEKKSYSPGQEIIYIYIINIF